MQEIHTQMDKLGRLLIPYTIRNKLQYKPGDKFIIREVGEELQIVNIKTTIKAAQELLQKHNTNSSNSVVDEFIEFKRIEAKEENSKF